MLLKNLNNNNFLKTTWKWRVLWRLSFSRIWSRFDNVQRPAIQSENWHLSESWLGLVKYESGPCFLNKKKKNSQPLFTSNNWIYTKQPTVSVNCLKKQFRHAEWSWPVTNCHCQAWPEESPVVFVIFSFALRLSLSVKQGAVRLDGFLLWTVVFWLGKTELLLPGCHIVSPQGYFIFSPGLGGSYMKYLVTHKGCAPPIPPPPPPQKKHSKYSAITLIQNLLSIPRWAL